MTCSVYVCMNHLLPHVVYQVLETVTKYPYDMIKDKTSDRYQVQLNNNIHVLDKSCYLYNNNNQYRLLF